MFAPPAWIKEPGRVKLATLVSMVRVTVKVVEFTGVMVRVKASPFGPSVVAELEGVATMNTSAVLTATVNTKRNRLVLARRLENFLMVPEIGIFPSSRAP